MIRVKSGVEHNPIGASLAATHPGLRLYNENDKGSNQAQFELRQQNGYIEEIYWSKNIAVLSRKWEHNNQTQIVRTFSRKTRILKCFWCSFEVSNRIPGSYFI